MSESRLAALFAEFLDAADEGRDIAEELLARAGDVRADLEAKIRLERELRTLSRELDLDRKTPDAPRLLGRFQILGSLGQGGIGRVFLAFDPELGRRIALKVLDREVLLDKDQRAWILNEARSLARISHSNVVKVFEVGETATHAYVAMEHLSGPSLQEVVREWKYLREGSRSDTAAETAPAEPARALAERLEPFSARIELLARLAEALAHCHDHGILHRDIKPQNVLFDSDGAPKLIDFGLAHVEGADEDSRLGLTQTLVGTAAYIAPEQAASDQTGADPRSDQFSFATLAYECFALENPFLRKTRRSTLDAIELADPPPLAARAPSVPPDLARVIRHAHEREPEARYPNLAALATDLRAILASRPISIEEPSIAHVARLWVRRHRRGVTVGGATLAAVLLGAAMLWAVDEYRTRRELLDELQRIEPSEFQSPEAFETWFEPLLELQRRARAFDAELLNSILWSDTSVDVRRTADDWSRSLNALQQEDAARSRELGVPFQDVIYRHLLWQESVLCPDCPYNLKNRRRGRVRYPSELPRGREVALDVLARPTEIPDPDVVYVFRSTRLLDLLVPGTYRLRISEPGTDHLSMETVFFVPQGWPPELELEIHAPREELFSRAVPVPRGERVYPQGRLTVPAFRILDHLVTNAEYDAFLAETKREAHDPSASEPNGSAWPAWVSYDSALAYAQWAGAHLPSRAELQLAVESGAIAHPEISPRATGELLLEMSPFDDLIPCQVPYRDETLVSSAMAERRIAMVVAMVDRDNGTGFRIAFVDDSAALLQRLALTPLESTH